MNHLSTIELDAHELSFSVAHFAIFSATERERLHGHNYHVKAKIIAQVNELGITFDYEKLKHTLLELCHSLDLYVLLPEHSPVLNIVDRDPYYFVYFDQDEMHFLKKEVKLLPIRNITIEELSRWFLDQLLKTPWISMPTIHAITIAVSNGHGRYGSSQWVQSSI